MYGRCGEKNKESKQQNIGNNVDGTKFVNRRGELIEYWLHVSILILWLCCSALEQ